MGSIFVRSVSVKGTRVDYDYEISQDLQKLFDSSERFFFEYLFDFDFFEVPDAILYVPLVMNLMPLVWLSDSTLQVETLDRNFYDCLNEIKEGFHRVYPKVVFGGKLIVDHIKDCTYSPEEKYTQFFTGGVDATSSLIHCLDKKPELFNIWGADTRLDDVKNHEETVRYIDAVAGALGLESKYIKSSIRYFYDGMKISEYYMHLIHDSWWHGAQHSIGMVSLMAPYAYANRVRTHFIAASFTKASEGKVNCVSFPFIDNELKFGGTSVCHDGYEDTRQDKINRIVRFRRERQIPMDLRVCFAPVDGKNCNHCEKCMRTIMGIVAAHDDPEQYGFHVNGELYREIHRYLENTLLYHTMHWRAIREEFRRDRESWKNNADFNWILNIRFNRPGLYGRIVMNKIKNLFAGKKS